MAGQLTLLIISPDRVVLDEQVDSVRLPGVDGSFGILPRHAPMIAAIQRRIRLLRVAIIS